MHMQCAEPNWPICETASSGAQWRFFCNNPVSIRDSDAQDPRLRLFDGFSARHAQAKFDDHESPFGDFINVECLAYGERAAVAVAGVKLLMDQSTVRLLRPQN